MQREPTIHNVDYASGRSLVRPRNSFKRRRLNPLRGICATGWRVCAIRFSGAQNIIAKQAAIAKTAFAPLDDDSGKRLRPATAVLAIALCETRDVLARKSAPMLALQAVNGMAKTARCQMRL